MTKRDPARWMCTLDERILERLADRPWSTPRSLSNRLKFNASQRRILERLRMLAQAGLVAPIYEGSDMYVITSEGEEYLAGALDAGYLPEPSIKVL